MLASPASPSPLSTWDLRLQQLLAFKAGHGHCNVPRHWPENPKLARWVTNQRRLLLWGTLPKDRVRKLEALGIRWTSRADRARLRDEVWDRMYTVLRAFHRAFGHLKVPRGWRTEPALPAWIATQRHLRKRGALSDDRVRRLNDLSFEWTPSATRSEKPRSGPSRQELWENFFAQLTAYQRDHGNCAVPSRWPENRALAHWVANQRSQRRRGVLSPDRMDRLTRLGFEWSAGARVLKRREDQWEKMLAAFKSSRSRRAPQPGAEAVSPSDLAAWVCRQRDERAKGRLRPDRLRRLEQAKFPWQPLDSAGHRNLKRIGVHSSRTLLPRN